MNTMLTAVVIVLVILVVLGLAVRIIKQYEQGVLFRFGRVQGGPRATMVTSVPKAPKTWPSSAAMNPPPTMIIDGGISSIRMIVSEVW